jgi:phospholipid/cholesterol/gamma-HCH transport system permease protein
MSRQSVKSSEPAADLAPSGREVRCTGSWTLRHAPLLEGRLADFSWPSGGEVELECSGITAMDTAGAWLLHRVLSAAGGAGRRVRVTGMKAEHETLLGIIRSRAAAGFVLSPPAQPGMVAWVGLRAWHWWQQVIGMLAFIGEASVALLRSLARPGRIRWRSFLNNLQTGGFNALPIVGLLSFLMGIVIAYQGAEQLRRYGANIFVVDLVGLSMLRELSPLLTAIIVAGRSGSAYAAQIGTMKVTEEIDALRTIGVSPTELLVLPKLLALLAALPLLTVYADILGVAGGMLMAAVQLDVGVEEFLDRFGDAISVTHYLIGVGKAPVFAAIIALVGCFQGFQATGSADSVGRQTTVSVVQAIFLVIVADAGFSVIFSWLKL